MADFEIPPDIWEHFVLPLALHRYLHSNPPQTIGKCIADAANELREDKGAWQVAGGGLCFVRPAGAFPYLVRKADGSVHLQEQAPDPKKD